MEGQATDWEEIFANHLSDTGLGPRIYKGLSKLNPSFSSAATTVLSPSGLRSPWGEALTSWPPHGLCPGPCLRQPGPHPALFCCVFGY